MIQILLHCCYYRIIKKIKILILTEMISNILCNQHGGEGTSHHKYIYIYINIKENVMIICPFPENVSSG